jgi:hypothetical protein
MPRPLAEMLGALEEMMNKYSAFQRSRPDLPQGNLCELSQDKLEQLVAAFQLRTSEQDKMVQRSGLHALSPARSSGGSGIVRSQHCGLHGPGAEPVERFPHFHCKAAGALG